MEQRLKVYAPAPRLRERALGGELELLRGRLEGLRAEIECVAQVARDGELWRDVAIATGIGLRALTAAVVAVPEPAAADGVARVEGLRVDLAARRQWYRGRAVSLTPLQHQVLARISPSRTGRF